MHTLTLSELAKKLRAKEFSVTELTETFLARIKVAQPTFNAFITVTNGTVWYVQGNYVILTLENGTNREYVVPESFRFVVEGKPASVKELRKGMKVSATKIVEEPRTEISTKTVITGKAPK